MDRKSTKQLAATLGFSDSRAVCRQLIEYRNRTAKKQAKRCERISKVETAKLFGGK
jgi:hypothetical protein